MVKKEVYLSESDKVLFFNIWVTRYCNFSCRYCYESEDKPSAYLSESTADRTVDFILDMFRRDGYTALWINFHGGEPMLNTKLIKHIVEAICLQDIRLYTSMTTNCSVWDDEICDYIQELTVSIDGLKETHDRNRIQHNGNGTYDNIIGNALKYLEKNGNVRLRMVVSPDTVTELAEGIKHLASLGFNEIIAGVDYFSDLWNEELFNELLNQYLIVKKWRELEGLDELRIGTLDEYPKERGRCEVGCDGYQVSVDGSIYPCTYVVDKKEFCIGDVFSGLDNEKIDEFNRINHHSTEACEGCGNYKYCISPRCLMLNYLLTGDYYTPSGVVCADENLKLQLHGYI